MRRRDILAGAGPLAAGAALNFPAPAIAQGIRQLKMVTDWPAGSPGLQSSAARLAERIGAATGGRINIEVFPAGTLVRPFETFDAVGAGVADMYHSSEYYWEKKSPAFNFCGAVPFGFTAAEFARVGSVRMICHSLRPQRHFTAPARASGNGTRRSG
jgi:TRAP-type mannitol/chloroaromatic compound transport system substrate-binding protein